MKSNTNSTRVTSRLPRAGFIDGLISGVTISLLVAAIMLAVFSAMPAVKGDMNGDGKLTLTDLVIAKRAEIQIMAKLLGEPDPFEVTP